MLLVKLRLFKQNSGSTGAFALPKIDSNEQPACICKMHGLMNDALAGNESKSGNVINL